jgi:5-methylthioadenosine/S-adenosylhomocysteine deaminase
VPVIERIGPAELEVSARLGCLEMLATGTTTAFYHLISRTTPDTVAGIAAAVRDAGLRLVVGKELRAGGEVAEELAMAEDALNRLGGGGLVSGGLVIETAGHWISRGTTTEDLIHAGYELAGRRGLRISNHVSTGTLSPERGYLRWVRETGRTDIEYLHMLGVLDEHWLLAHAIWLTERDIELIAASGASVIDTPTSQAMRGGGVTPAFRLDGAGVRIALGTDGPMVDASIDMVEQAKALLAEQHQVRLDAAAFDSRRALELATRVAAEAIGLGGEIGSLEPGKRADVAVFDLDRPHVGVVHDPLVSLVTAARGADARWVLVGGEPRVDDGRLVYDRYAEVASEAATAARSLAERAGVGPARVERV